MSLARTAMMLLMALLVGLGPALAADDRSKGVALDESADLTGVWSIVKMQKLNVDAPEEEVHKTRLIIDGDSISFVDKDTNLPAPHTIQGIKIVIGAKQSPKWIDFIKPADATDKQNHLGIFKLTGDTLVICGDDEGKDRPKEFSITGKPSYSLMELKRESRTVPEKK